MFFNQFGRKRCFELKINAMKQILPFVFFAVLMWGPFSVNAQSNVLHVVTHRRVTVTTDPSKGIHLYPAWGKFPDKNVSVRRIIMKVVLGCPDSLPCAHWDYLDPIYLRKAGGTSGKVYNYELSRMLTPYGSIFTKDWQWEWQADVTDFSALLRDSVEIVYQHSGYETTSVGWAVTIDFEITTGPEIVHPLSITPLWNGSFPYGNPDEDITDLLKPISFSSAGKEGFYRIRIQQTGHGMDQPRGCSEFCSRWREIFLDHRMIDHQELWKDCGDNPLYPQGGTWIYDRALWCPGTLQPAHFIDFEASPGNHTLQLLMQPYKATADKNAAENIASFLIAYSLPSARNDVALEEILVPSNKPWHRRSNPSCSNPVIRIRNLGRNPLRSVTIQYGVKGRKPQTYVWKGNLGFYRSTEVILPGDIPCLPEKGSFEARLLRPNGQKDAWEGDNVMSSEYVSPPVIPSRFILQFMTNNKPQDNTVWIENEKKETVYIKKPEQLQSRTLYQDTISLQPGCYTLTLADTAGDGLEFWYEPESGYGYMRLLDMEGRIVHAFESDCGNGERFAFQASENYVSDTSQTQYAFILYPRRTRDNLTLDFHSDKPSRMRVIITSDGKVVETHSYEKVTRGRFTYHLAYLPRGRYIIEVLMDDVSQFKRRFNLE